MTIKALYPVIKPSLLIDFANAKRLDPRAVFTRAGAATYYDGSTVAKAEENLLLYSQAYDQGVWAKTDATIVDVGPSLGPELVTNGTFDTDTDWTKGTGWTIGSGVATKTAGTASALSQNIGLLGDAYYQITFTMTRTAGVLNLRLGSPTIIIASFAGNVTYTIFRTSQLVDSIIYFSADASFAGTIDNVSVKRFFVSPNLSTVVWQMTADAANGTLTQPVTTLAAEYTFSVYLRRVTGTGDVEITADSAGTWVTKTLTSVWQRFDVTQTLSAGTSNPGVRVVTSGDVIEVWGAQLEQRSTHTAYMPTTTQTISTTVPVLLTALAGVARFDHNPVTEKSLGFLREMQRTNLNVRSQEFLTGWTLSASIITGNVLIGPDGALSAQKLILREGFEPATTRSIFQPISGVTGVHTASIYAKAGEFSVLRISILTAANTILSGPVFTLTGNGIINDLASAMRASITPVGNGWFRCDATFDFLTGATASRVYYASNQTTGDGVSGVYIWGAQLEAGAFATSYIRTAISSVTRPADVLSIAQGNSDFGTFLVDASVRSGDTLITSGTTTFDSTADARQITAVAYDSTDTRRSINGAAVTSSAGTTGDADIDIAEDANGHIAKVALYPQKLTDTNLQALTV